MNYRDLKTLCAKPLRIAITTHKSPDGDAIGSSLALKGMLDAAGHISEVIIPDAMPGFLAWMKGSLEIINAEEDMNRAKTILSQADLVFSLDYNNLDRIGPLGGFLAVEKATKVLIDHHIDPSDDFDYSLSDTNASSTSELVYRFAVEMGLEQFIDVSIAECLYAGILTDTGSFKFPSTSAQTHRIVASLMDVGLKPDRVHNQIFDTNSFDRLRLIGFALSSKLEFLPAKQVAIIPLSLGEKNRFKYQKGDTEGLVNYGLSIMGAKMAVFLSEELTMTKFSFRSKGDIDVNVLARKYFGGGGHKNAAGGKLDKNLNDALDYLRMIIETKFEV